MNIKLEDLEINGYKIYQDKDSFNFGIDAVLLANFALRNSTLKSSKVTNYKICDFCSGTLPIPLIMHAKRKMFLNDNVSFTTFEIDSNQVALSLKSIEYNKINCDKIDKDIEVINDDIKNIYLDKEKYKSMYESYDMITCNPPYIKVGSGIVNLSDNILRARHEISITFEELCKAASLILKSNKKFYIINRTERFSEITMTLKKYSFEIKKAQFIYPFADKNSNLVLIEAVKNASSGITILKPIIIYESLEKYTKDVLEIYGK